MTKIMVVEDDNSLREIYSIRLTAENYEVVSAGDGEEALAVAVKEKPDLILSDVMMPKISGFDMLDILRQTPETMNIKVIMMTALSSEDQRQRGEGLGADKYLVKSQVGIEDVINAIHEVLGDKPGASPAPVANPTPEITQMTPAPQTPVAPQTPEVAQTPVAPQTPEISTMPEMSTMPKTPQAPAINLVSEAPQAMPMSQAPATPQAPEAPVVPEMPQTPINTQDSSMPSMNPVMPEIPNNNPTQPNENIPELDAVAAELSAQQGMINSAEPEEKPSLTL